ncbi:MAG: DeoR family transcriptional regulator [Candidatus Paceibacterota bacterium]
MRNSNDNSANRGLNKAQKQNDNSSRIAYISQKTQRLAGALYALTRPFPADEPLRRQLRDQALNLLSSAHTLTEGTALKEADTGLPALLSQLQRQLAVAKDGSLISSMNFSVFCEEIQGFLGEIDELGAFPGPFINSDYFADSRDALSSGEGRNTPTLSSSSFSRSGAGRATSTNRPDKPSNGKLSAKDKRRQKILALFNQHEEITVGDVTEIINGYSTKTIQRDLKALVKTGELEKHGKRRWSSYTKA